MASVVANQDVAAVPAFEDAIALVFAFDRPGVSAALAALDVELVHDLTLLHAQWVRLVGPAQAETQPDIPGRPGVPRPVFPPRRPVFE